MSRLTFPFTVAARYLRPSRRARFLSFVTLIAVMGTAFGTIALLVSLSILQGFDQTLRTTIVDFMGDIEVTNRSSGEPLPEWRTNLQRLEGIGVVSEASPFIRIEGILRSDHSLEGVMVKGIDPDVQVTDVTRKLTAGSFDLETREGELPRAVLGERLAEKLQVGLGDTLVFFVVRDGASLGSTPILEEFVVEGFYRSGMAQYDDIYLFTSLASAEELAEYPPGSVTGYDVLVRPGTPIRNAADSIAATLGHPHDPQPVFDIFVSIFAWLELQRQPIPVVLGLIIIVAMFNIVSTLLMTVLEKTEQIGVFTTLGARPWDIVKIFVAKGLLMSGVGVGLGAALSLTFSILQQEFRLIGLEPDIYVIDAVPVVIDPVHYVAVIFGTLLVSLLATLVPATIAARLKPVSALRFQ